MQISRIILLVSACALSQPAFSQAARPNSLQPGKNVSHYAPSHTSDGKVRRTKVRHTARYEYYVRVEKAAKEKQRILRKLHKDQFADPRFFGHKHIPKRRPSFKMRYCPECGIRH